MTGADNSDKIWKPSPAFKRLKCFDCFNQYTCDQDDNMISSNCFKKIPKGFEWDVKHREWIDNRCNNSKLKKLVKESVRVNVKLKREKSSMIPTPAICITPFNTVPLKRIRKKEDPWQHYPHIPILETNARLRRSLLGLRLQWTFKEDGQNITIWKRIKQYCKKKQEIVISSHNQEIASMDIKIRVMKAPEFPKILKLIEDNPTFRVNAEECAKGASITGIKRYPKDILIVFDIFDTAINNFLPYTQVYQYCYHYKIPVVQLYATTRHRTIKDLVKFANHVLEYCNTEKDYGKDEGMVCKAFRPKHRCRDCGKEW